MEFSEWLLIAAVCVLGAASPGPSFVVVVRHTLSQGRFGGIAAGLAHSVAIGIYAALTVAGLGFAIQLPWLLTTLRIAGAAFLLYVAVQLLRGNGASSTLPAEDTVRIISAPWHRHSLANGFLIAFLNPKVLLFFTALFSQFLRPTFTWWEKSIMVVTATVVDAAWYILVAVAVSQPAVLNIFRQRETVLNRIFGAALILVAARLLFLDPLSNHEFR